MEQRPEILQAQYRGWPGRVTTEIVSPSGSEIPKRLTQAFHGPGRRPDTELRQQSAEIRVFQPGIEEHRNIDLFAGLGIKRVGIAAEPALHLKQGHIVPIMQEVSCGKTRHPSANDCYLSRHLVLHVGLPRERMADAGEFTVRLENQMTLARGDMKNQQQDATDAPEAILRARLDKMIQAELGPGYTVRACAPMADGHAGLTWGFDFAGPDGVLQSVVLKMSPAGVPRSGSTDIFRQATLLRALHRAGLPVPAIRWASPDEATLGAPFIVMEKLAGRTMVIWQPHASFLDGSLDVPSLWTQTATALGALQDFRWQDELAGWESPASLDAELERWKRLLRHTEDKRSLELANGLLEALTRSVPDNPRVGLVHGDVYPGNVLFDDGRLVALIDWDLAAIAPLGIDVGWLLMMGDVDAWAAGWKPFGAPSRAALLDAYHAEGGPVADDIGWYQAFAHFRMASIAGLNLKLHRSGRRPDDIWERFAPSIPRLLERGPNLI
jgi:aminoglycoside phosphotransferase (APT) family kinase protein